MRKTSFGSTCLEDLGIVVERVHDEIGSLEDDMQDISNGDGSIYKCVYVPSRTITLDCRAFEDTWADFDSLISSLVNAFLISREEQQLRVRTRNGYYMAHFTGYAEGDREGGIGVGAFELTFVASDPYLLADEETSVSIGTSTSSFVIGGGGPVRVRISCDNARRAAVTKDWGVMVDNYIDTILPVPVSTASSIVIDSETRTATVNGESAMLTLQSNWLELPPGEHLARVSDGSGNATLKWRERSL